MESVCYSLVTISNVRKVYARGNGKKKEKYNKFRRLSLRANSCSGSVALTTRHPSIRKFGTNFADKWRSLDIVRSQTRPTEFFLLHIHLYDYLVER
jgi:hypothetical protein